ncbi:M23 family metallopeptidase [Moraxella lacunata]|nr:M23 family metallopeptidase [Moraxella lacunata]
MIESSYCTNTPSHALTGKSGFSNMSLGVVITLGLALSACANKPTYQQNNAQTTITPPVSSPARQGVPQRYQVQRGDTVSKIATRYGLNWREVSRINRLDSNHTIRVGQWLTLWHTSNPAQAGTTTTITQTPATATTPRVITVKNPMVGNVGVMKFDYPVGRNNKIVRHFGEISNINGINTKAEGMWFTGSNNDIVRATRSGTVVHADNTNTGGIITISHSDGFVSSYLHVKDVSVRKGQSIGVGDLIAKMKQQQNGATLLEFRIAKNGVYIDPVTVLK